MRSGSRLFSLLAVLLVALASPGGAAASPAQVIIIRHAEKPLLGADLSDRGEQRAQALVRLFKEDSRTLEHGPVAAIFAMEPGKAGGSRRAVETMAPLAEALHLRMEIPFPRDAGLELVHSLLASGKYEGATVVICWEHEWIPEIARAFGWEAAPIKWADADYDRMWILDFDHGKPVRFRNLPEKLLPGDAVK